MEGIGIVPVSLAASGGVRMRGSGVMAARRVKDHSGESLDEAVCCTGFSGGRNYITKPLVLYI